MLIRDLETALRMLWRDWRGGQLHLVFSALVLAVMIVTALAMLANRVERSLEREMGAFIGADLAIESSQLISPELEQEALEQGLQTANVAYLMSVVYTGEESTLVSLKVVSDEYPLRGQLEIDDPDTGLTTKTTSGPEPGNIWLEPRLLSLLKVKLGDQLEVGNSKLTISRVLRFDPESGVGQSMFSAQVIMNMADLEATGLILPGSRVEYRMLFSGSLDQVNAYQAWAKATISPDERIITPANSQENMQDAVGRGTDFLLLAATIGVILASIALALAAQQYASRLTDRIALMKAWGQSAMSVRTWLLLQLLILGAIACLLGLAVGWIVHFSLASIAIELLGADLPEAGVQPIALAVMTGFICVLGFALPPLWKLPEIAPLRVLRRDIPAALTSTSVRIGFGILAITGLVFWYSNAIFAWTFLGGTAGAIVVSGITALSLLGIGRKFGHWGGSYWRLGFNNLWRRKVHTLLQLVAFSVTIMLLVIIVALQTSLIDDWKAQLPENAPNYFIANVAEADLETAKDLLAEHDSVNDAPWYPIIRARIRHVNDVPLTQSHPDDVEVGNQESNLSWSADLPVGNTLINGTWWDETTGPGYVSVAQFIAQELNLSVGDRLGFVVGNLPFDAEVKSIREVNWDNMTPNFSLIFSPGSLDGFPATWISSAYIDNDEGAFANAVARALPTAFTVRIDEIVRRIRTLIDRLSSGLKLMVWMVLGCGLLVLFATIGSSLDQRRKESAILRTIGSSRSLIIGSLSVEFLTLGFLSAITGLICAEVVIAIIQTRAFDLGARLHPELWPGALLAGTVIIGVLGVARSLRVVTTPPLQSLREAA